MRRVCLVLGVVYALALVVPACGGGGGQPATSEPEPKTTTEAPESARKIPEPGESLSAGNEYVTIRFEPKLSFRVVDEGWEVVGPEIPDIFDIARPDPFVVISFNNPTKVFDPKKPAEQTAIPEPEDWVAWLRNHPYLKIGEATPVTIGGISGMRFDVQASSVPKNYPERCGVPCIPLWPLSDGGYYDAYLGDKERCTVVEVGDETVIIAVLAQPDKVEELLPKAEQVLDTVEWEGA